jgi:uroporphyrin-III C-methyltransferase
MNLGKVYLVGAGPGHPELLTIKAAELLRLADVLVYDRLVQEEILCLSKPSVERIYMGKPVGKHDSRQEEIHAILEKKAREGKLVVRLKGGDPFLFGRGGEEAEYLAEHGIPFEVIPGVSSALAAPLSAGISVTHRDRSSCVAIITGHEAKEWESRLNWKSLAGVETLVFLMCVKNADRIAQFLMDSGRSPETPAAMIQMAFWHDEHVVEGTLANIAALVEAAGIKPPATMVVGEVVRLREKLKVSQRDLKRRADGSSRFEPAPAPDQLFRLATAAMGTQTLGFALEEGIFDRLEEAQSAAGLAAALDLDGEALCEILEALVAQGLLEKKGGGYRNLELASRYLNSSSPQTLKPAILFEAARAVSWKELAQYVRSPPRLEHSFPHETGHESACEILAGFTAPFVAEKLELAGKGPVLLVGWGGEAYRDALAKRWPSLPFSAHNPFLTPTGAREIPKGDGMESGSCGVAILSGLLSTCDRGEVARLLEETAALLKPGGVMALHDAFLPASTLPPPEIVLGSLGRRISCGGCRQWSMERLGGTLQDLGFSSIESCAVPGGTLLVTAIKKA